MNLYTQILTKHNELEECRILFSSYISSESLFDEYFLKFFNINYKTVFGNIDKEKFLFNILKDYYRNDFFIRFSFIRKFLSNSSAISFEELPIGHSRVDLAAINGKSVAYEIKSEFDNFSRLKIQVENYSKCFEYVYVICPKKSIFSILKHIPNYCGIISISDKLVPTFKIEKPASFSPNLSVQEMLRILRKKELVSFFGCDEVSRIIKTNKIKKINMIFKKALKERFGFSWTLLKSKALKL